MAHASPALRLNLAATPASARPETTGAKVFAIMLDVWGLAVFLEVSVG